MSARSMHLRGGCRDFDGPFPSVPLDEQSQLYGDASQGVNTGPDMWDGIDQ
jgi:hypothetical protein